MAQQTPTAETNATAVSQAYTVMLSIGEKRITMDSHETLIQMAPSINNEPRIGTIICGWSQIIQKWYEDTTSQETKLVRKGTSMYLENANTVKSFGGAKGIIVIADKLGTLGYGIKSVLTTRNGNEKWILFTFVFSFLYCLKS
eukprot:351044_1